MTMDAIETIEKDGLTALIGYEECIDSNDNPRERGDRLGCTILAWHRRSDIGDKGFNYRDVCGPDAEPFTISEFAEWLREEHGAVYVIPLYLYEHSGMTLRVSDNGNPFSCQWDSGQVGFAFVTQKHIDVTGGDPEQMVKAEVEEYDAYLRGEVYRFEVQDAEGDYIDGCGGYLGDIKYCREEAESALEAAVRAAAHEGAESSYWAARDVVTV
jgi:hypothetical protein